MLESPTPSHEREAIVGSMEQKIHKHFPLFTQTDRNSFLNYDEKNDPNDIGHILWFYSEAGNETGAPSLGIIYRPKGFVINYYNTPAPDEQPRIRNRSNSMYGPMERRYLPGEEDFALEKAKVHMEGIIKGDQEPYEQLVGWSEDEERFITLGEKIKAYQESRAKIKDFRESVRNKYNAVQNNVWKILEDQPGKARELAIARLKQQPTYRTFTGEEMPTEQVLSGIMNGSDEGRTALYRQLHIINAYETLLRDHQIL